MSKTPSVADALAKFGEQLSKSGDIIAAQANSTTFLDTSSVSSGSWGLDVITGTGGFPVGRITEIYGPSGGGKTTLALSSAKLLLDADPEATVAIFDLERGLSDSLLESIGIDKSRLLVIWPDSGETAVDTMVEVVESGLVKMIIVDSIASLAPQTVIESDTDRQFMGVLARLVSRMCMKLVGPLHKHKVTAIMLNQIRTNLVAYGAPEESTGGKSVKFYSSVRVEVRTSPSRAIKDGPNIVGTQVTAKVTKSRFTGPGKTAEYNIMFGHAIDREAEVFSTALALGVIRLAGRSYYVELQVQEREVDGEIIEELVKIPEAEQLRLGTSKDSAREALLADRELFEKVSHAAYLAGKGEEVIGGLNLGQIEDEEH